MTLCDVCALSPAEAEAVTRGAAQALLAAALAAEGADGATHGKHGAGRTESAGAGKRDR